MFTQEEKEIMNNALTIDPFTSREWYEEEIEELAKKKHKLEKEIDDTKEQLARYDKHYTLVESIKNKLKDK